MAIVFISPRKKQRALLWAIAALLVVFLISVSLIVFYPNFLRITSKTTTKISFKPVITINSSILDSDKVKNLELISYLPMVFTFIAQDQKGKQILGNISAANKEKAQIILEGAGFKIISLKLKEVRMGRSEPFVSY